MIVEEKISGTLCRVHSNDVDPKYVAQWFLTDENEIKGLMFAKDADASFVVKEFGAWIQVQKTPIKLSTTIRSIAWIIRHFGFKEFIKE